MLKWGLVSVGFGGEKVSCPWVESVSSAALRVAPLPSVPGVPGLLYPPGQTLKGEISNSFLLPLLCQRG